MPNERVIVNPNFKNSRKFHKSLRIRGVGTKNYPNTHTEVEYLGGGKFAASIGVGHRVFFDKTDGNKPKKHKLTDERPAKDYVLIQGPKCCVEVYPYYAKYFDIQHEEVRLYEERWVVQRLFRTDPEEWRDVDAYNPQIAVEEYSEPAGDVVKVTVTYDTDYGPLTVEYFQRDGNALKHNLHFPNTTGPTETFRIIQRWAGIVGAKCNGKDFPLVTDEPFLAFRKADGKLAIAEKLYSMMFNPDGSEKTEKCLQRPVKIDSHAQGMKADFIYGNWVLAQDESLEIDPDTATLNNPTEDGRVEFDDPDYDRNNNNAYDCVFGRQYAESRILRTYVEWNILGIDDEATIVDSVFKYHGRLNNVDGHIHEMRGARPSTSTDQQVYDEAGEGTVYAAPVGFPVVATNQSVDLGASADSDIEAQLGVNWFALGFQGDDESPAGSPPGHDAAFWAEEKTDAATPKPTLYVEYTASQDYPISLSPGLTASVSIDRDVAWDRGSSPGLKASATIARALAWDRGMSPGLTALATIVRALTYDRATTLGLTVAVTIVKGFGRLITTNTGLTISTTISKQVAYARAAIADLTASITVIKGWGRAIATIANLTVSATVAITKGFVRAVVSNLTASATVDREVAYTRDSAPGLTVSATVDRVVAYARATLSDISIAVSIVKSWGRAITTSPGLTVSITVAKSWERTIATSTDLAISTTISKVVAYKRSVSADLTAAVTIVKQRARLIVTNTGVTLSVTINRIVAYKRATQAALSVAVSITRAYGKFIATSPGLSVSVSVVKVLGYNKALQPALSVAVSVVRMVAWDRAVSAGLTASTIIAKSWGKTITTAANLAISTTVARTLAYKRAVTTDLSIAVSILRGLGKSITTTAGLTISATISRVAAYNRSASPGLTVAVSLVRSWTKTIVTSTGLTVVVTVAFGLSRFLSLQVITSQYRNIKTTTSQFRFIKTITGQYRQLKTITAQYRLIKTITAMYRKIKNISSGG